MIPTQIILLNPLRSFVKMTEPNKIYFSYRDVNGELQHALTTYEDAGPLLGDIMTQLCEYLAWLKNAPGGKNEIL